MLILNIFKSQLLQFDTQLHVNFPINFWTFLVPIMDIFKSQLLKFGTQLHMKILQLISEHF